MSFLSRVKDRVVEQGAVTYLNGNLMAPYGRITSLRIDSATKTITMEAELKGEAAPVRIEITDYEISQDGEKYFAQVKEVRTSREWLTALATNHLCGTPFELPARVGSMLARAL